MRWILFAISLVALFGAFNSLFMIPGPYSITTVSISAFGIAVGSITAWFSGRQFMRVWGRADETTEIVKAPPVVLCIFIFCLIFAIGLVKFLAYR